MVDSYFLRNYRWLYIKIQKERWLFKNFSRENPQITLSCEHHQWATSFTIKQVGLPHDQSNSICSLPPVNSYRSKLDNHSTVTHYCIKIWKKKKKRLMDWDNLISWHFAYFSISFRSSVSLRSFQSATFPWLVWTQVDLTRGCSQISGGRVALLVKAGWPYVNFCYFILRINDNVLRTQW